MRRFARRPLLKRPVEPKQWFRQNSDVESDDPNDPVGTDIFAPNTLALMAAQDFRVTVLRIKLVITGFTTQVSNFAVAPFHWVCGVVVLGLDEVLPDPYMVTDADVQADWLGVWSDHSRCFRGADSAEVTQQIEQSHFGFDLDVKAKRKLDADQRIVFVAKISDVLITGTSSPSLHLQYVSSVLWQRTLR